MYFLTVANDLTTRMYTWRITVPKEYVNNGFKKGRRPKTAISRLRGDANFPRDKGWASEAACRGDFVREACRGNP